MYRTLDADERLALGPDSLLWRYAGDTRIAFLGSSIGLLKLMHPAIGQGVLDHSNFFEDPSDRVFRSLPRILGAVYDANPDATGKQVRDFHKNIKGDLANGEAYHALDPSTYWWAHATFQYMAEQVVDRWDRKKVMVTCDIVRGAVMLSLPWLDSIWQLVLASLLLEVATLLWSPAKEASVPNLVPAEHLTTVNSLSLAAAYGTFPPAAIMFSGLTKLAEWLSGFSAFHFLESLNNESLALYFDALTFVLSAVLISTLPLVHRKRSEEARRANQLADNFVLITVIMATVLFFAGVVGHFKDRRLGQVLLGFAVVLLIGGIAFMLSMPQDFSV